MIAAVLLAVALAAQAPLSPPAPTLTLTDAFHRLQERGVDVRVAAAEADVASAQADRAFSVLLPRIDVDGSYAFNCQLGGDGGVAGVAGVDCADQTTQFVSDNFLSGQELLFHAVADANRAQAQQAPDPAQQQALLARADALDDAGTTIGKTDNDPVVLAPAHIASGNLTVSVPLLLLPAWTALESANDVADFRRQARDEALRLSQVGLLQSWLAALAAARVVDVAEARFTDASTRRGALEAAEAVGGVSALVVDGARLEELAAEAALLDARTAARRSRARIGVLLGDARDFALDDNGVIEDITARADDVTADVDGRVARAVQSRFALRQAALSTRLADRDGRAAWMGFVPEVRAFAQLRATTNTGGFVAAPASSSLGLSLRWSLYDGGERGGRVDAAVAQGRIAQARADDAAVRVEDDVRAAVDDVVRARAFLQVAERAVRVARDRLQAVELAVSAGARSDVDLSAAAAARHSAEVDVVRARVGVAAAVIAVDAAGGAAVHAP